MTLGTIRVCQRVTHIGSTSLLNIAYQNKLTRCIAWYNQTEIFTKKFCRFKHRLSTVISQRNCFVRLHKSLIGYTISNFRNLDFTCYDINCKVYRNIKVKILIITNRKKRWLQKWVQQITWIIKTLHCWISVLWNMYRISNVAIISLWNLTYVATW